MSSNLNQFLVEAASSREKKSLNSAIIAQSRPEIGRLIWHLVSVGYLQPSPEHRCR